MKCNTCSEKSNEYVLEDEWINRQHLDYTTEINE